MLRVAAILNHVKCASVASSALVKHGARFVRPMSVSAVHFSEDAAQKRDHDVDALFSAESNMRSDQQSTRRHRHSIW